MLVISVPPRPGATRVSGARLSLTLGVEHRGDQGLSTFLSGPDDELEGLIVPLARLQRRLQQGLYLRRRCQRPVEHEAMAEHDQSFLGPKIEMAEPKLLVDLRNELVNFWQTVVRHLEIEGASQMQHLEIV